MFIVRKKLSADELNPPGVRYILDTDTVQTLVGSDWIDTPNADPRINPGALLPARTGDDAQCNAAANVVAKVRSIVDARLAITSQALLVSTIVGIILLFAAPLALIIEVVWGLAELLLTFTEIELGEAFTETVYGDMLCYFFANMDANGQMTADNVANVLDLMNTNHPGIPYNVFSNIVATLGVVGLNNAGANGEEVGDCSDCGDYYVTTIPGQLWANPALRVGTIDVDYNWAAVLGPTYPDERIIGIMFNVQVDVTIVSTGARTPLPSPSDLSYATAPDDGSDYTVVTVGENPDVPTTFSGIRQLIIDSNSDWILTLRVTALT